MGRLAKFFNTFSSNKTVRVYGWVLKKYFKLIYGKGDPEKQVERYFEEKRDYEDDINNFFSTIKNEVPTSVSLQLTAVRTFLIEQNIELPQRFWRRLRNRKRGTRTRTMDKVPTHAELRKILSHMDAKGRALFITLASSGMRIGECLKLKLDDVYLDDETIKIKIRGEYTKTGNPRIAFASKEAKEAIQEWLKVRERYIIAAARKIRHLYNKPTNDDRLFPFEPVTGFMIWRSACRKAGYNKRDEKTKRFELHPHVLRKFFRTQMGKSIQQDVAEALMGHEGYLTETYRRYSEEDLEKLYHEGEPNLLIFAEAGEVTKLRKEIEERNKQLQILVNGLAAENMSLKTEIGEIKTSLSKLDQKVRRYEAFTRRWMDMEPEELEQLGLAIRNRLSRP